MAAEAGSTDQSHKSHRTRLSGASANKKKSKSTKKKGEISENDKKQNPRVCIYLFVCVIFFIFYFVLFWALNL